MSTAIHLPSPLIFSVLQEELLAGDLSRHCRQVSGSGYFHGNTSQCRQTVPSKQGGEGGTVASFLMRDLGLGEGEQDPTAH